MQERIEEITKLLEDKKAEEIVVLDVRKKVDYADFFVICSAHSTKHAQGIADYLVSELEKKNLKPLSVEGLETGNWIILDYDTILVHIFFEPIRGLYALEELWADFLPPRKKGSLPQKKEGLQ